MNKSELLKWVNSLPDDAEWLPIEMSSVDVRAGRWDPVERPQQNLIGGLYQRSVETRMSIQVEFKETEQGEFLRRNGIGHWFNLKKI